ncbi:hypothetical protein BDV93DRAFT_428324, partial [Ceratobasidium sp. AG-I]
PDLNIIENIWDLLDRRIHSRDVLPQNKEELWVALQEEWLCIPQSTIDNLYASLPDRVLAVMAAKGGNTGY